MYNEWKLVEIINNIFGFFKDIDMNMIRGWV